MKIALWIFAGIILTNGLKAGDIERGNHLDALLRDATPLYEDAVVNARVSEVGSKVVAASHNPNGYSFRFLILNSPEPTAFAVPGGYVYITTGLLRDLKNEDELAAVLAHEVGHVNERHGMKTGMGPKARKLWSTTLVLGSMVAGQILGAVVAEAIAPSLATYYPTANGDWVQSYTSRQQISQIANFATMVVQMGTTEAGQKMLTTYYKGYKDEFEYEADELAVSYARTAGYRPEALLTVFERLGGDSTESAAPGIARLHSTSTLLAARAKRYQEALEGTPTRTK